ncbi:hypothetical protein IP84_11845 [beta proteobacterium AAP99]|nr:hypothetical protein IP84_11845 [beta proteobacterium AAP99]
MSAILTSTACIFGAVTDSEFPLVAGWSRERITGSNTPDNSFVKGCIPARTSDCHLANAAVRKPFDKKLARRVPSDQTDREAHVGPHTSDHPCVESWVSARTRCDVGAPGTQRLHGLRLEPSHVGLLSLLCCFCIGLCFRLLFAFQFLGRLPVTAFTFQALAFAALSLVEFSRFAQCDLGLDRRLVNLWLGTRRLFGHGRRWRWRGRGGKLRRRAPKLSLDRLDMRGLPAHAEEQRCDQRAMRCQRQAP